MQNDVAKIKELMNFTKTLNILYVEDNDEARMQTLKMLQNFFASIDTAVDGMDGLEKFERYHDSNGDFYDLIISDINMPNMDGISMSQHITTLNPEQQIIVISAFNDTQNLQEALASGVKHYIHKPIELKSLITVIEEATEAIRLVEA